MDNNNVTKFDGHQIPIFRSQSYHNITTPCINAIAKNQRLINEIDYYPRRSCCSTFQKPLLTDNDHQNNHDHHHLI